MKFNLSYTEIEKVQELDISIYEGDHDLMLAYINKIQDAFLESGNVQFELECLGEKWNVMIFYDFSLFTEHLLDIYLLCDGATGDEYKMWYYEQGIDRTILFSKLDTETIKIENISGEKWISPLPFEIVRNDELKREAQNFVTKIKEAVDIIYPELNNLEKLKEWYACFK